MTQKPPRVSELTAITNINLKEQHSLRRWVTPLKIDFDFIRYRRGTNPRLIFRDREGRKAIGRDTYGIDGPGG